MVLTQALLSENEVIPSSLLYVFLSGGTHLCASRQKKMIFSRQEVTGGWKTSAHTRKSTKGKL